MKARKTTPNKKHPIARKVKSAFEDKDNKNDRDRSGKLSGSGKTGKRFQSSEKSSSGTRKKTGTSTRFGNTGRYKSSGSSDRYGKDDQGGSGTRSDKPKRFFKSTGTSTGKNQGSFSGKDKRGRISGKDSAKQSESKSFKKTDGYDQKGKGRTKSNERGGKKFTNSTESEFLDKKSKKPQDHSNNFYTKKGNFSSPKEFKRRTPRNLGGKGPAKPKLIKENNGEVRLNRYIANSGVCSRREADNLILEGLISINGEVVTELGYRVKPNDKVRYDGRLLNREKPVYVLLNKPKDFITTLDDPQERKTVMHLIGEGVKERIYPVGRLDRNTTGLLLLTNDGELADYLMHPSNQVHKIYEVMLDKPITRNDYDTILAGKVRLEDGVVHVDTMEVISSDRTTLGLEIHEGRNRIVRRLFEALDYQVVKLDRTVYAGLTKLDLPRGHWRHLSDKEVGKLKSFTSKNKKKR